MGEEMVKCPGCGSINSSKRTECVYCHSKLYTDKAVITSPAYRQTGYSTDLGTEIKQPIVVNNYIASSNTGSNTALLLSQLKSQGIQFLLSFFFGVFGLFYSSVAAFFIVLAIEVILFGGLFLLVTTIYAETLVYDDTAANIIADILILLVSGIDRIIAIISGIIAVHSHNKKIYMQIR